MYDPIDYRPIFLDYLGRAGLFHHEDNPTDGTGGSGSSGGIDRTVKGPLTRAESQQLMLDQMIAHAIANRRRLSGTGHVRANRFLR